MRITNFCKFYCPKCNAVICADTDLDGKKVIECSQCGNIFHDTADNTFDWSVEPMVDERKEKE